MSRQEKQPKGERQSGKKETNMSRTLTLVNTFHNTFARVRDEGAFGAALALPRWERTRAQQQMVRRVWRTLCGIAGCTCGNEAGMRS